MHSRQIPLFLAAVMLLTACTGQIAATSQPDVSTDMPGAEENQSPPSSDDAAAVKTGFSIVTSLSGNSAAADKDGVAQTDITLVAVTVDDNGIITDCVIDMVQAKINFRADGTLVTEPAAEFPSKNELGRDYGMHNASSIDRDWSEQAAALADYVVGKTAEEVTGIAVDEAGKPTGTDLTASVTISIGSFLSGIEEAAGSASHLGARKGDTLKLETLTTIADSTAATAETDGSAQVSTTIAAVTMREDTITGCYIDAVQTEVSFDAGGQIISELPASVASKNQLGRDYGMHKASSIGREWNEQAAAFCQYVTGKTVREATGIAVNEAGKTTDADLSTSVTISIGDFLTLLTKAGQ